MKIEGQIQPPMHVPAGEVQQAIMEFYTEKGWGCFITVQCKLKAIAVLLLISVVSHAATYNVYQQQSLTGTDVNYTSAVHNAALSWCTTHAGTDTIYLDSTKRWHIINANNAFADGVIIKSAQGKYNIFIDDTYTGSSTQPVFISYGNSNYGFVGASVTGIDNRTHIGSLIQCNSYGSTGNQVNTRILFTNCDAVNLFANDVVRLANSDVNQHHFNDSVIIKNSNFTNIYDPLRPVFHDEDAYHSSSLCDAIDNEQTTLREEISGCTFTNVSGRGVAGYGWSLNNDSIATVLTYGNWYIHNNHFAHLFKFLELNGGGLMRAPRIEDNIGFDWTADFGHATSITGYYTISQRNKYTGFDRPASERYGIGGLFKDTLIITKYYTGCGGTPVTNQYQIKAVEEGEYAHTNSDSIAFIGYTQTDNVRRMCYLLTGRSVAQDIHPTSWRGQSNAGYVTFDGVHAAGGNAPFVGSELEPFDNIIVKNNCRYRSTTQVEPVIEMLGDYWNVRGFTCRLNGSQSPRPEQGLVGFSSLQASGKTHSKVGPVRLDNSAWNKFLSADNYFYFKPVIIN